MSAQIRSSLQVSNPGGQQYQSNPTAFNSTQALAIGPTPGTVEVTHAGIDVSLAALVTPGLCRLQNLDPVNHVEWGIKDSGTGTFYPVGRLNSAQDNNGGTPAPNGIGDTFVLRLSPYIGKEETGSGSGGTGTTTLHLKTDNPGTTAYVLVEAFNA